MDATLHYGRGNGGGLADDELSGMTDGGGAGKGGDFGEGDFCVVGERVGEAAEAGTKNEADAWAERGSLEDGLGGGFGEGELVVHKGV
jgi:hypothetical protein